jgi:hypothetical protein
VPAFLAGGPLAVLRVLPEERAGSDGLFEEPTMSSIPVRRHRHLLSQAAIVACILAVVTAMLAVAVDEVRESADRISCNLGNLQYALHLYHDDKGGLPPAVLYGKDGKPLHSWRVLILPYIEEDNLYKEFRLDEPWDSEHNIRLLPRMPRLYAGRRGKPSALPPHHTVLHVFVGRGTAFEEHPRRNGPFSTIDPSTKAGGLKVPDDFPDGPEHTLLFVEAGEPVPWTKPQELLYDPEGALPELRGLFRNGFRACTVRGSYLFIRHDTDEKTLRALITRNGGEKVDAFSLKK